MNWFADFLNRGRGGTERAPAWALANAEISRDKDPRFFSIPRGDQRRSRQPGDRVQIQLISTESLPSNVLIADRPWVQISHLESERYRGVIQDGLTVFTHLEGQKIQFGAENIIALTLPEEYVLPYELTALVSDSVWQKDAWPARVVRSAPLNEEDSGWRVLALGEAIDAATVILKAHQVISRFQVLDSILDEPKQIEWHWNSARNEYARASDV
jgi:hypothetical protein